MTVTAGDRSPTSRRRIPLQGAHNCRDLGGLPTADGRVVRPGRVLRCDSTAGFTDDDVALLTDALGLRTVLDLRTRAEVLAHPSRLRGRPVRHVNLPIRAAGTRAGQPGPRREAADVVPAAVDDAAARPPITGIDVSPAADADAPEEPARRLAEGYQAYLEGSSAVIVAALELLAEPGTTPALVHCTAGKDRTGVVVAMLLSALGVPAEHIVGDYAATDPNMPGVVSRIRSSSLFRENGVADLPPWVFRARPDTMRAFLHQLDADCGGALPWLLGQGLSPATVDTLRAQLLTSG
jgi:protein tyrosine/serine phosphatase